MFKNPHRTNQSYSGSEGVRTPDLWIKSPSQKYAPYPDHNIQEDLILERIRTIVKHTKITIWARPGSNR